MSIGSPGPCSLCPTPSRYLPGDGPLPCRVLYLGETPGKEDHVIRWGSGQKIARPYVGWAGKEFNLGCLPITRMSRDEVYFTNVAKCFAARTKDGLDPRIAACCSEHFLRSEIRRCRPELVVLMGAKASRLSSVPLDMELHHGFPVPTTILGIDVVAMPVFHPSEASHDSGMLRFIREDFLSIKRFLDGRPEDRLVDEFGTATDYQESTDPDEFTAYLNQYDGYEAGLDTENTPDGRIWCITVSTAPGTARLVRTDGTGRADCLLRALRAWMVAGVSGVGIPASGRAIGDSQSVRSLTSGRSSPIHHEQVVAQVGQRVGRRRRPYIWLHNSPHDWAILDQVGCAPPAGRFGDTMQLTYHQALYGQGLKTLAYRLAGMSMREFADVVLPFSEDVMCDWLQIAESLPISLSKPAKIWDEKENRFKQPQPIKTKIAAILRKVGQENSKGKVVPIHRRWLDLDERERLPVEFEIGPFPLPSIEHVPFRLAVDYACRDADATRRIVPILRRLGREIERGIPPESREEVYAARTH